MTPLYGFGAWPVWLYWSGFSAGEENAYLAPCWAKPAVTALCRSLCSWSIAAVFAVSAAPGEPAPVCG